MTIPQASVDAELVPYAGYIRVSDERGRSDDAERYRTMPMQRKRVEALAAAESGYIAQWYVDEDEKGDDPNRPGYVQLLDDLCDAKLYAGVIANRLDRFGRKQSETIAGVERLREAGRRIIFVEPRLDTSDPITGPILLGVFSALAHIELVRIRETWNGVVDERIAELAPLSIPYGYVRRGTNGDGLHSQTLVPDEPDDPELELGRGQPAPADVVRDVYAMRKRKQGWTAIADELNAHGVLTPTQVFRLRNPETKRRAAKRWTHSAVYGIVENVAYRGVLKFTRRDRDGEVIAHVEHEDAWQALVDRDTWDAAQPTERAIRNGRTGGALLQGLVRCAYCTRTMRPSSDGNGLTYRCVGKQAGCSTPAAIVREALDDFVVADVRALLAESPTTLEAQRARDELDALDAAVANARAERRAFYRVLGQRVASGDEDAISELERHDVKIAELERERERQRATKRLRVSRLLDVDAWDEATLDERQRELADVVDAIFVERAASRRRVDRRDVSSRVAIAWAGQAPRRLLPGSGRSIPNRRIDLDVVRSGAVVVAD